MNAALQLLQDRISNEFLAEFCKNPKHPWRSPDCFNPDWSKVHEVDAADCLRGLDGEVVRRLSWGRFQGYRTHNKEQFFHSHPQKKRITLGLESIITLAALARLHFDLGWPKDMLGGESRGGAFDVATYVFDDSHVEYIAGEVKKCAAELEQLIELMTRFGRDPSDKPKRKQEENSFNKIQALRSRRPPLFWAVGPGGSNYAFRMGYAEDESVCFDEIPVQELNCHGARGNGK